MRTLIVSGSLVAKRTLIVVLAFCIVSGCGSVAQSKTSASVAASPSESGYAAAAAALGIDEVAYSDLLNVCTHKAQDNDGRPRDVSIARIGDGLFRCSGVVIYPPYSTSQPTQFSYQMKRYGDGTVTVLGN